MPQEPLIIATKSGGASTAVDANVEADPGSKNADAGTSTDSNVYIFHIGTLKTSGFTRACLN